MPAQQQPIELDDAADPQREEVVEFGPDPSPRRRFSGGGDFVRDLAADSRAVPLLAGLSAVAVLASLFSEWQVTTVDAQVLGGDVGERTVPAGLGDLSVLGTGYLIGVFLVVATVVLTMFGPPPGRRYARLAGLSAAGTLLGLVIALAASLGDHSRVIERIYTYALDDDQLAIAYGRGLWCALAGVLLALAALYLAGRHLGAEARPAPVGAVAEPVAEPEAVWSWRRPAPRAEEADPDEPLDLTVAPAKPFTSYGEDRDQPR